MVNDCIQIGLETNVTSMRSLSLEAYHKLDKYAVHSGYRLTAISAAANILRNYRKALRKKTGIRKPYARKLSLVAYYGVKIRDGMVRVPIRASEHVLIPLNPHVVQTLANFRVRLVTLTEKSLSLAYEKPIMMIQPMGYMGVDRNLNNVTTATTSLQTSQFDLSRATEIKSKYRDVKRRLKRNDHKIRQQIYGKYGRLERDKVQPILHHASQMIVAEAKNRRLGIVMEDLRGIRKLYRKGNWQGRNYRGMMNGWSYYELQRQIEYKAKWEGLPVIYVNPWGTSSRCAKCGSRLNKSSKPEERRTLQCPACGFNVDRDINAALNIATKGALRFGAIASASEAMESVSNPLVDADELTRRFIT